MEHIGHWNFKQNRIPCNCSRVMENMKTSSAWHATIFWGLWCGSPVLGPSWFFFCTSPRSQLILGDLFQFLPVNLGQSKLPVQGHQRPNMVSYLLVIIVLRWGSLENPMNLHTLLGMQISVKWYRCLCCSRYCTTRVVMCLIAILINFWKFAYPSATAPSD